MLKRFWDSMVGDDPPARRLTELELFRRRYPHAMGPETDALEEAFTDENAGLNTGPEKEGEESGEW